MQTNENLLESIRNCIVDLKFEEIVDLVKEGLAHGLSPYQIFTESVAKGLDVVGQKYESQEYFLSELLGAAEIAKKALEILNPYLQDQKSKNIGTVVLATVKGDLHDIGKNVLKMLLISAGFIVHDLGVDVPAQKIIEKVREIGANIVALSALLTTTVGEMKTVIGELEKANLREKVKVIVGGAAVSNDYAKEIGADGYGSDAAQGTRICKEWMLGGMKCGKYDAERTL